MINEIIQQLSNIDVTVLGVLVILLGLVMLLNIILGSVYAGITQSWDTKKFFIGIIKAILVGGVIVVFGWVLEALPIVLSFVNIELPTEMIKLVEIISVILVAFKKYAKGVWDKLLVLLDVTEADVEQMVDEVNGVVEEDIPDYDAETKGEG